MRQWEKIIASLGFSDSEAQIYLAALELGPSSVQIIAKKAGLSRVTVYAALEALMKSGLMSTVQKEKKKLFAAEPPERLLSVATSRTKQTEDKIKEAGSYIDELKLIERGEKPAVKVFEGADALDVILNDTLHDRPSEILEFGNMEEIHKHYADQKFFEKRDIFSKELDQMGTKRKMMLIMKNQPKIRSELEKFVSVPKEFNFSGDVFIYGKKVVLSTFREKHISVLIENAELTETIKAMFEIAWKKLT